MQVLLVIGLMLEVCLDSFDIHGDLRNLLYRIYIPLEYLLLTLLLAKNAAKVYMSRLLYYALGGYLLFVVGYFFFTSNQAGYPGLMYNVNCALLTVYASLQLLTINVVNDTPILKLPLFWLYTAIVVFYSGIFFYNAVFEYLNINSPQMANSLRLVVNLNINYLFYLLLSYTFICSIRLRKYSTQL